MDFVKICLTLGLVQLAYSAICREGGHCERPTRDKMFELEKFKANTDKGAWYMKWGDPVTRAHVASTLKGDVVPVDSDYSQMCGRSKAAELTTNISYGNWFGFDKLKATWTCHRTKPGILDCDLTSAPNKYNETDLVYISKTDNINYMVVIFCYQNMHSGWFSLHSTLSVDDSIKKTILDHVESLGFDRDNVVSYHNDKCAPSDPK